MKKKLFSGCAVALITPFKDGYIDYFALKNLIDFHIKNGIKTFVLLGTTGEPCTLSNIEKKEIIKFVRANLSNKFKLIIGTGGNDTQKVVKESIIAEKLGADGLLIVTPYYNKCTQDGLIAHYKEIDSKVNLPIILYNVPSRTNINILPQTVKALIKLKNIAGIKDCCQNASQICELMHICKDKLAVYSGDDELNYIYLALGASGVISVTANLLPKEITILCELVKRNEISRALNMHENLLKLNKKLFIEINPIPIKFALYKKGFIKNELRLPLTILSYKNSKILLKELNLYFAKRRTLV